MFNQRGSVTKVYKPGDIISNKIYQNLTPQKQAKCASYDEAMQLEMAADKILNDLRQ